MTRTLAVVLGAVAVLSVGACSSSTPNYPDDATGIIEETYQPALGFGELTITCDEPSSSDPSTTFDCEAGTPGGAIVRFVATIEDGETVSVQSTNVLGPDALNQVEAEAARILSEESGIAVAADSIDCGHALVAEAGQPFVCALRDPASPTVVYDASITLDDIRAPTDLQVAVASDPRPAP